MKGRKSIIKKSVSPSSREAVYNSKTPYNLPEEQRLHRNLSRKEQAAVSQPLPFQRLVNNKASIAELAKPDC